MPAALSTSPLRIGTGNGQFQQPRGNGTFLKKLGGEGDGNGQFEQPRGVALDRAGTKVYVADTGSRSSKGTAATSQRRP